MSEKYTPTTTHGEWASGHPRLILSGPTGHGEFALETDLVRIGSSGDVDVRIVELEPLHAEIHHDVNDEYVLVLHGPAQTSAQHAPVPSIGDKPGEILRTGARFVLGDWAFIYERDEYADHGRPYGGREGGEGTHQHHQPPRPDYTGEHPVIAPPEGER